MFGRTTPEKAGISSKKVLEFIKFLDNYNLATHSIVMVKGYDIFADCYYAPFTKNSKHRMYSTSKTFAGVGICALAEQGKLSLDDKVIKFFPEYDDETVNDLAREMTIRDALVMETSMDEEINWFYSKCKNRCDVYFKGDSIKIPGTQYRYDSPMSFMLGVIIEKITGMPYLEFLKDLFLRDIGFCEDSYCLKCPGGYSFADSAVMCTAEDLGHLAKFMMNLGTWKGKRYMGEELLRQATTKQIDNNVIGTRNFNTSGYGYQTWILPNGFYLSGMGCQFAVGIPEKDLIFVINSDNQGNVAASHLIFHALQTIIVENMGEPMADDAVAKKELDDYIATRKLIHMDGATENPFADEINGRTYVLDKNPMGIEKFSISFDGKKGILRYTNAQGDKELPFGMGYNEFAPFPEENYADMIATIPEPGNKYDCAASAGWTENKKLSIKVQIIDKYLGNMMFTFSFKDERVCLHCYKIAEAFLDEYEGNAIGRRI